MGEHVFLNTCKHPLASLVYLIAFSKAASAMARGAHGCSVIGFAMDSLSPSAAAVNFCRGQYSKRATRCRMQPVSKLAKDLLVRQIRSAGRAGTDAALRRRVGTGGGPAVRPGVDAAAGAESLVARRGPRYSRDECDPQAHLASSRAGVSHSCFIPAKYCVWRFPMFPAMTRAPSVPGRWSRNRRWIPPGFPPAHRSGCAPRCSRRRLYRARTTPAFETSRFGSSPGSTMPGARPRRQPGSSDTK